MLRPTTHRRCARPRVIPRIVAVHMHALSAHGRQCQTAHAKPQVLPPRLAIPHKTIGRTCFNGREMTRCAPVLPQQETAPRRMVMNFHFRDPRTPVPIRNYCNVREEAARRPHRPCRIHPDHERPAPWRQQVRRPEDPGCRRHAARPCRQPSWRGRVGACANTPRRSHPLRQR